MRSWWMRIDKHGLEALLGLALLSVGILEAVVPILKVTGPLAPADTRQVDIDGATQVPGAEAAGEATLRGTHHAELTFADPSLWERLLLVLPTLAGAVLLIAILVLLFQIARTFQTGDAFVPRNKRRLDGIALAVLLIGTLVPLLETATTYLLVTGTPAEDAVEIAYTASALWVLVAVLIEAVAGAFGHGARLRADTEGLV